MENAMMTMTTTTPNETNLVFVLMQQESLHRRVISYRLINTLAYCFEKQLKANECLDGLKKAEFESTTKRGDFGDAS